MIMNIEQQNADLMAKVQTEISKMENVMNYYYAVITENNIVCGVSDLSGPVDLPDMISITSYDETLVGKLWTGTEFIDNPNPPVIPEPPSAP